MTNKDRLTMPSESVRVSARMASRLGNRLATEVREWQAWRRGKRS